MYGSSIINVADAWNFQSYVYDIFFSISGSAAVGVSPLESADPARGPAWGSGAVPAFDPLGSEKYGLEE